MENCRHMPAMIQKLQRLEVEKMGQILCVKKVHFANPVTFIVSTHLAQSTWH